MRYFDDDPKKKQPVMADDKGAQAETAQEGSQQPAVQQEAPVSAPEPVTAPAITSPAEEDYSRKMQEQYATTLADIRRRRQEMENKYQPDIEKQKRVMKIIALGKLIGQLGQLGGAAIGGAAGTPVVDKDPYQINAWKRIDQMEKERQYYGKQLDAQEAALQKSMYSNLGRLEQMREKQKGQMALKKYEYALRQEYQTKYLELKAEFEEKKAKIKSEADLKKLEQQYEYAMKKLQAQYGQRLALANAQHSNRMAEITASGAQARATKASPTATESFLYGIPPQGLPEDYD